MSHTAKGTFVVNLQALDFEGANPQARLGRMSIDKTLTGDLNATTRGQMLSAMTEVKGSAGYVAIEVVTGALHGRNGSFVLQHSGQMSRGTPSLSIVVVPDSGTGQLQGLEGEFEILVEDGVHCYTFNYALPDPT